jgi:hypothetical protein
MLRCFESNFDHRPSDTSSVSEVLKAVPELANHQLLSVLGLAQKARLALGARLARLLGFGADDA